MRAVDKMSVSRVLVYGGKGSTGLYSCFHIQVQELGEVLNSWSVEIRTLRECKLCGTFGTFLPAHSLLHVRSGLLSVDLFANEDADVNVVVSETESWTKQGRRGKKGGTVLRVVEGVCM